MDGDLRVRHGGHGGQAGVAFPGVQLEGIHHISAITGDARRNVDFYTRVLGLRLVAKTVNQDDPSVYHLFYGDEEAHPGGGHDVLRVPLAKPGRAGAGMIHRIVYRVGSPESLAYWADRLRAEGIAVERDEAACASPTPRRSATSSWSTRAAIRR